MSMKSLFVALQDRLDDQVAALRFIDWDLGQLEMEPLPPLSYPAALISFGESPFQDLSQGVQQAVVLINVRLVFRTFERTSNIAADDYRAVGLAHLDTVDAVKWALHNFEGTNFTKLSHRFFLNEPRADLRVYTLSFETVLTDMPPTSQWDTWPDAGGAGDGPDFCFDVEADD